MNLHSLIKCVYSSLACVWLLLSPTAGWATQSLQGQADSQHDEEEAFSNSTRDAILKDDATFFDRQKGRADHWPFQRESEFAEDPLEASALWGSPKAFRILLAQRGVKNLSKPEQVHLLNLCIQSLPGEVAANEEISPGSHDWYDHLGAWYERVRQARMRKDEILETLIKQGFPIDLADEDGMKPIHQAAFHANVPALRRLLAAGANVNEPSQNVEAPEPMEPLHGPATGEWYAGKAKQQVLLIARNRTPLELVMLGRYALATRYLSAGQEDLYFSPDDQKEAISLLIAYGADVNHRDANGQTPLMLSAGVLACANFGEPKQGDDPRFGSSEVAMEVIKCLLGKGADPCVVASDWTTVLSVAANAGFKEAIPLLKRLVPRELPVSSHDGSASVFDPHLEALIEALDAGHLESAKALFSPGMAIFSPGHLSDEDGHHPSAVELASRRSIALVELLIATEKDPALVQHARNLELIGILQTNESDSFYQGKGQRLKATQETLDRGARIDPKAGFEWGMLQSVLSSEGGEGDALFLRMLNQELPIDQSAVPGLLYQLFDLPAPRDMELLKALHDKAGSFEALPDKRHVLMSARKAKDENLYPKMVQWIGTLDDVSKVEELVDAVIEEHMSVITYWLDHGVSPYVKSRERTMSAIETVWKQPGKIFGSFLNEMDKRHMVKMAVLSRMLGDSLSTGNGVPGAEQLDALTKVGVTLKPFAQHPLWAKPKAPKDPADSFYAMAHGTPEALVELAKRGVNLNRKFEGEPFLAGYVSHQCVFIGTDEGIPHNLELIREALRQGASPKQLVEGTTLLHYAVDMEETEMAALFLEAGVSINTTQAPNKCTPLIGAAQAGHSEMVQWLLDHGADPNRVSSNGWSALGIAIYLDKNKSHQEVIESLEKIGAKDIRQKGAN